MLIPKTDVGSQVLIQLLLQTLKQKPTRDRTPVSRVVGRAGPLSTSIPAASSSG